MILPESALQHSNTPTLQQSVLSSYSSDNTILTWQLRLRIGPAEPRALGVNRRKIDAVCATASLTNNALVFKSRYSGRFDFKSSALATADFKVFATMRAPLRGTTASTACVCGAGKP